jgi:hypothetical protein
MCAAKFNRRDTSPAPPLSTAVNSLAVIGNLAAVVVS